LSIKFEQRKIGGNNTMKRITGFFIEQEILVLSLFLLTAQTIFSQPTSNSGSSDNVENVNYTVSNGRVFISYDLRGDKDQLYKVFLALRRTNDKSFAYIPKTVSGDIGEGHFAGINKGIVWEIKNDFPDGISGEDFYFIVQAEKVESGSNILMWAGIGVAAVAAAVTYIIVGGSKGTNSSNSSFPPPPGRP